MSATELLRACRAEAYRSPDVDALERLVASAGATPPELWTDSMLAAVVEQCRIVRCRLARHRELTQGVL